ATDGSRFWSLHGEPPGLVSFDRRGAVTDSLHLEAPDASQLAFDGTHFWTIGWFLRCLYEVDATGHVVAICDLPHTGSPFLSALAVEGSHLWYAEQQIIASSTLHRITLH
ncbi:MAG: hypothetical protein ACRENN_08435, partial [Candidatus Eiseniibacteriota bacterium]